MVGASIRWFRSPPVSQNRTGSLFVPNAVQELGNMGLIAYHIASEGSFGQLRARLGGGGVNLRRPMAWHAEGERRGRLLC